MERPAPPRPTIFEVKRRPELRRLLAIIGLEFNAGTFFEREDELYKLMLDIAPEYLPPDDGGAEVSELHEQWAAWMRDELRA